MYTGTAKFTRKSVDNEELTCKITGPPVEEGLEKFAGNRFGGQNLLAAAIVLSCRWPGK